MPSETLAWSDQSGRASRRVLELVAYMACWAAELDRLMFSRESRLTGEIWRFGGPAWVTREEHRAMLEYESEMEATMHPTLSRERSDVSPCVS